MSSLFIPVIIVLCFYATVPADVAIVINENGQLRSISPYIYGKNNCFSDNPGEPISDSLIKIYRDAGVRIFRENGGNNSTKYNWSKKLSSHPDWYNNVYKHDWGYSASEIQNKVPQAQGMYALQLLGWAASDEGYNFDCWNFDKCAGKLNNKNLAGGVSVEQVKSDTNAQGDPLLYLQRWLADSTVGILRFWFESSPHGLRLDSTRFRYWNMDNEPEVWGSTHDDIADTSLTAEQYMQLYFEVAKKARAIFPGIKLVGPVFTNEWQWWAWKNKTVSTTIDGRDTTLSWVEYFIKRVADEQKASGVRLLDVIDFHWYPEYNDASGDNDLLQLHRFFYDSTWIYPKSNGIHLVDKKWGTNVSYYFFSRVERWLEHYLGKGHGVTIGMTEFGTVSGSGNAMINALNYASMLGTFGANGVELFTPWQWIESWWEVLHLFSRYGQPYSIQSLSSLDSLVSAYPMIGNDTLTVILLNRDSKNHNTEIDVRNIQLLPAKAQTLQLNDLPAERTFISHEINALVKDSVSINNNKFNLDLPSFSITAVMIPVKSELSASKRVHYISKEKRIKRYGKTLTITNTDAFEIFDVSGKRIRNIRNSNTINLANMPKGIYIIGFPGDGKYKKLSVNE